MKTKFKIIFSIIVIVSVIVISSVTILSIRKKIDDKTVKIAFYGLSQDLCQAIQQEFLEDERISAKYDLLAAGNVDLGNITNKYDMIFAWNGEVTQTLSKSAERIPSKVFENIPISLKNEYCIPILLDHFELAFNTDLIEKTQVNPLESFQSFTDFLQESKKYVFSPFFTYGIDEKMLLALTGSFVEALGGLEAYKNLIDLMKTYENLEDFCNDVASVVEDCNSRNGYTTCMWHNLKTCKIIYDEKGNVEKAKERFNVEYPQKLRQSIIERNMKLLSGSMPAYDMQIKKAVNRNDYVSINHRVSAFLESYFDIIFAMNKLSHPGEKRLVQLCKRDCKILPDNFESNLDALFRDMFTDTDNIENALQNIVTEISKCLERNNIIFQG